jgi:hypothetical protein
MSELLPENLQRIGAELDQAWRPVDETRWAIARRGLRRRMTIVVPCVVLLGVLATFSYATYFSDPSDVAVNEQLRASAAKAKPLTPAQLAARSMSLKADTAAAACIAQFGAHAAECAPQEATANALHGDPAVRSAVAAEALLIDAAWYCVQQEGFNVNGGSTVPGAQSQPGIWDAFAACKRKVGVPE